MTRLSHEQWRDQPVGDFAYVMCEICGVVEFLISAELFDRADFAELVDASGWSIERGVVTCPDCLDAQLHQGRKAES